MKKIFLFLFLSCLMGQLAAQYVGSPTSLPSACPNVNLSGCSFVFTGNGIKAYVSNVSGNTVTLTVSKCITIAAGTLYVKETDACGAQVATSNFTAATTTTISFTANHTGSKTFVVTLNVGTGTVTRYYSNNITVTQLSAPSNVYPSDGQAFAYTTASSGVVLQWAKNNNAGLANYEVRLVNTTSGSTVFDYTNVGDINSTGVTSGLQVGNAYRWIVRILGTTLQSTATTFSIGSPPAVVQPTTTSPTNNYVYQTVPSSIQFTWLKNNGAGLCDYIVNLRDNTTGTLLVDDNSGNVGDSNTFSYYTFNAGHDYQWVVRARGKINTTDIKTTSAQLFSIKEPIPSVPTLSPTSGYANYINNAHQTYTELRLTVPPYTSKVRLQIANDDGANGYGYSAANGFSALRFYNGVSIPLNNLPSYVSLGSGQTASSIYNNGGTVIFRIPIGQTGYDLATAMPYGETFVYTAKCLNSIDETSNYCPVGYFRTMMPPAVFTAPPSSVCAGSDYNYTWVTVPSSKPLTAWRLQVAPENTAFNAETGLSSTSITFAETNTLTDISATRLNANGQLRLAPGRYICTMRWSNGTVESAFSAPRQFTVTCDAPMNLAGIEPSSTGFKATWNAVAGAVSYRISVYKNGAGAPSNYSSTTNEATFTTLLSGTNYSFKVTALCSASSCESLISAESSLITTLAAFNCPAPTNPTATNVTATSLTAQWGASASAISYEIKITNCIDATFNSPGLRTFTVNAPATTYDIPGLTANTGYMFRVEAICANSQRSGWANSVSSCVTTTPATSNLSLATAMSFGSTNLTVGQTYTFTTSIKNTGNAAWSGTLVLKIDGADAASRGGFSVPAGGTTPVSLSYPATTSAIGNNLPTQLFYVTGGVPPGSLIAAGTFQNPITINILAPATTCSGCVQWANGTTLTSNDVFCLATNDLCTRQVIIPQQNSANNFYKGIQRKDLAVLVFKALFGSNQQAMTPASNFPVPFMDMRNATGREYWYNAAKTLAYLQFSDETTPFDRTFKNFRPNDSIVRKAGLKVIMEAWNLHPEAQDLTSPQVFTDVSQTSNLYGYVQKAARLGIITGNNNCGTGPCFNPTENMTRNQAFTIIYRLLNKLNGSGVVNPSIPNAPTSAELQNAANYYVPFNVTMANLANLPDMSQGNFNHYTKSSFSMAGRGFPLAFEHSYNSFLTEMPDSFFISQSGQNLAPLGIGWTHSYNSYIQKVDGYTDVSETGANITVDPKFLIAWADGSFQSYDRGANAYDTEGVYDDLRYTSGATEAITITTKNQMYYRFESSANLGHFSLVSIKDRNNNGLALTYNSSKKLETVRETYANGTSNNNRSLTFAYSGDFLSSVTDNSLTPNRVIQFRVNATEKDLESFVDATSKTTTYTYGLRSSVIDNHLGDHLLTTITLPKGNTITNSYFQRKLTSTKTNPNGAHASRPSTTTVNWQNQYAANVANEFTKSTVTTTQNGGSLESSYSHDVQGRVKTANTPTSNVAVSAYGTGQNVYKPQNVMVTPRSGGTSSTVAMSYDPQGNVKEVQRTYTEGGVSKTLISGFTYTALNDIKTATDARGNTTTLVYGDNKNLSEIRRPLGSTTTITRNPYFQIASVTNPEGIVTNYEYNDANGNLSRTFIQSTNPLIASSATYDGASRVKTTTDPENKTTAVDYDNNDNVLWERDHLQSTTRYDYDANDNLRHITDALQQATEFVYSTNEDFLLSESFGGQTKNYTYNEDGSLKTFTRGSRNFAFTYNTLGQMTADGQTTLTYDNRNRIATSTYQNRVIQYFYDDLDRMTAYEYTANGRTNRVEYTYDENSNVRTIKYAPNRVVTYTYDALNRMKTVTDWNGIVVARYEYKLDGRMDYVLYNNGVRTTYAYETASGRMNGLTVKKSTNETIAAYTFGLDKVGNHTTEQITEPLLPTALSSITNKNISGATYEYNRIKQYGDRNFGVDGLGNVATEGSTTNTFDVYDNLTAVTGTNAMTAEYDASGMRRQLTQNGTTTRYVLDIMGMGNILMETDANGNPQNYYIHGATGLICRLKADATTTHYYHGDFRSSIVAMTDANQNITHKYAYDPFGTLIGVNEPANDSNPFRYVGQQGVMFDAPNRYFMRARYYDPSVGRFVSEDPIWGVNLYPYAGNNPIIFTDPLGTFSTKVHEQILDFAFGNILSLKQITTLKSGSADADGWLNGGQNPENSYKHAMRDGTSGQTVEEAKSLYDTFLSEQQRLYSITGKLSYLGHGMHALMDSYSESHKGFQSWDSGIMDGVSAVLGKHNKKDKDTSNNAEAASAIIAYYSWAQILRNIYLESKKKKIRSKPSKR